MATGTGCTRTLRTRCPLRVHSEYGDAFQLCSNNNHCALALIARCACILMQDGRPASPTLCTALLRLQGSQLRHGCSSGSREKGEAGKDENVGHIGPSFHTALTLPLIPLVFPPSSPGASHSEKLFRQVSARYTLQRASVFLCGPPVPRFAPQRPQHAAPHLSLLLPCRRQRATCLQGHSCSKPSKVSI